MIRAPGVHLIVLAIGPVWRPKELRPIAGGGQRRPLGFQHAIWAGASQHQAGPERLIELDRRRLGAGRGPWRAHAHTHKWRCHLGPRTLGQAHNQQSV